MRKAISLTSALAVAGGITLALAGTANAAPSTLTVNGMTNGNSATIGITGCVAPDATGLTIDNKPYTPGASFTVPFNGTSQTYTVTCTYAGQPSQTKQITLKAGNPATSSPTATPTTTKPTTAAPTTTKATAAAVATIEGRVFTDRNGNGTYDAGVDTPLGGSTIVLFDANGKELKRATAGADGYYAFPGMPDGTYYLKDMLTNGQTLFYKVVVANGVATKTEIASIPGQAAAAPTTTSTTQPGLAKTGGR